MIFDLLKELKVAHENGLHLIVGRLIDEIVSLESKRLKDELENYSSEQIYNDAVGRKAGRKVRVIDHPHPQSWMSA
jgi:hypothetical protein